MYVPVANMRPSIVGDARMNLYNIPAEINFCSATASKWLEKAAVELKAEAKHAAEWAASAAKRAADADKAARILKAYKAASILDEKTFASLATAVSTVQAKAAEAAEEAAKAEEYASRLKEAVEML